MLSKGEQEMSQIAAAFVHNSNGYRMHVVTSDSRFSNFKRGKMTNLECAERLAKGWEIHGVKCVVSEGIYSSPPIGYSFDPEFVGISSSLDDHGFPDYMDNREIAVCKQILDRIFDKGYAIAVNDGEEWATKYTRDRRQIERETAATDVTIYRIGKPHGPGHTRIGDLVLIHGNHEDVLSDMSAPNNESLDFLEKLMKGIGG
jgi:hypothetical protein